MDAARYYTDLTSHYEHYASGTHGWHYGVWGPDVRSHAAALVRSNEVLLRDLAIDESELESREGALDGAACGVVDFDTGDRPLECRRQPARPAHPARSGLR